MESYAPDVTAVARRNDLNANLSFDCGRNFRHAFVPTPASSMRMDVSCMTAMTLSSQRAATNGSTTVIVVQDRLGPIVVSSKTATVS